MVDEIYTKWYNFVPLTDGESKQMDLAGWRMTGTDTTTFKALRENIGLS